MQLATRQGKKVCNCEVALMEEKSRKILLSLFSAMKSSRKSQRALDEWDKNMGLNRSHSRTMIKSMNSRKKLMQFSCNETVSNILPI